MKLLSITLAAAATLGLAGSALAAKPAAAPPKCPACKMALSTKKTSANPTPVKINGKTYYCCAKCDMNKKPGSPAKSGK